jgi:serine phosphatase RsbU (regulator of sigma subunit)
MSVLAMRNRLPFRVAAAGLLTVVAVGFALGQEPKPAELTPETFAGGNGIELARAWRFHAGDEMRWADPALDDTGWELADPRMPPGKLPQGGWPGIGWFRRHLRVDPTLWGRPLALTLLEAGAAEVYLDGELLYRYGTVGTGGVAEVAYEGRDPRVVVFPPRPDHVLAVRYSCAAAGRLTRSGLDIGFVLALGSANTAIAQHAAGVRRSSLLQATFTGVAVFLALLHLALYFFYPKMRENLFYAFCMAAFAVIVFCEFESAHTTSSAALLPLRRFGTSAVFAAILFGLLAYYAVRTRPWPRSWRPFAAAGAVLIVASLFQPLLFGGWAWYLYFAAMIGEIVRVEWSHKTIEREESGMVLVGFVVLAAAIALQVLINVGAIAPIAGMRNVYLIGLLGMAVTQSLSFARTLARTSLHLERRLTEVQTLSGQLLEQERTAHSRELQTRLLEAENARKGKELEEGRALQLSMLPLSVPEVGGLDIAAAMTTASEVGGDYFDFRSSANGGLVIAVGDATGHGVAAGIMVTAVKAVLATVGGEASLATMLSECDRVLRGMNVRPLHMCLTVARVTPRSVAFCSAAMPPGLICRATNGEIEELGVGGLPLGGRLSPRYQEQNVPLAPGDTLLFATDGFHELLDPNDNALGFEGVKKALRRVAGAPANEVVARLTAEVSAWRGDREQDDDITFVVVRVQ